MLAGPQAADDLARLPEEVSHGPSHLGVIAHTAAFRHGGPWLDELLGALGENRSLLGQLLATHLPGVAWTPPEATYLAWLNVTALGLADPIGHFEKHGVGLSDGAFFGAPKGHYVRINFGCTRATLTEALRRMKSALIAR